MVSPAVNGSAVSNEGLPPGDYTLIGWDMDTTGRRLIDEICHIGAYTPTARFSQYIMPHGILNPGARRRHNIRVVTIGRYRMLKDSISNKVLKTKSEVSALTDFLDWLEAQKGDSNGIILIIHEPRKVTPQMLLEALSKYDLVERFRAVVVGFTDGHALASDKCRATVKSFSLRVLSRVLLDNEGALESAAERASTAFKVANYLSQGEQQDLVVKTETSLLMCDLVRQYSCSTDKELADLRKLKSLLDRQNTFRPVFGPLLIRTSKEDRLHAATLRRLLAEAHMDYQHLKGVWDENKLTGLEKELSCLSVSAEEDQVKELLDILDCHFDPDKEAKRPKPRVRNNRNGLENKGKVGIGNKTQNADEESGTTTPDTTSSGSPAKIKQSDTGLSQSESGNSTNRSQAAVAN